MIYVISLAIYVAVLSAGLYLVKKRPHLVEKWLGWLCFVGLMAQLVVNYLFWGSAVSFNPLATLISPERSSLNLMYLAFISIFCYASLLALLFKANDFYHD